MTRKTPGQTIFSGFGCGAYYLNTSTDNKLRLRLILPLRVQAELTAPCSHSFGLDFSDDQPAHSVSIGGDADFNSIATVTASPEAENQLAVVIVLTPLPGDPQETDDDNEPILTIAISHPTGTFSYAVLSFGPDWVDTDCTLQRGD